VTSFLRIENGLPQYSESLVSSILYQYVLLSIRYGLALSVLW